MRREGYLCLKKQKATVTKAGITMFREEQLERENERLRQEVAYLKS